jgi:hypothetical protein
LPPVGTLLINEFGAPRLLGEKLEVGALRGAGSSPIATVIIRKVRVRDLPSELRTCLETAPEDVVEVMVDAGHCRKVAELLALVQRIGAEAERRGLTDEKLSALLDER